MAEIKKVMEKDADGISRQIMPETVAEAVHGLEKYLGNINGKTGVSSVNGQTGQVNLTKEDLGIKAVSENEAGLLTSNQFMKIVEIITWYEEIGKNLSQSDIIVEKVDEDEVTE